MTKVINYLEVSTGTSRGADTYGMVISRLKDTNALNTYKCKGCGYDMLGSNLGEWLEDVFQAELVAIKDRAHLIYNQGVGCSTSKADNALYGMTLNAADGSISLNGACGVDSMIKIGEAIGIEFQRSYYENGRRRGETKGWYVEYSK